MFTKGTVVVQDQIVDYLAKVSQEPSEFGIDGGCVYYLNLSVGEDTLVEYDRGWDIYPENEEDEVILDEVLEDLTA